MKKFSAILLVAVVIIAESSSVPTDKRGPKDFPINDRNLNPDYDHESFLGKDQAPTFDQLPPGEARRRLGIIVTKIDKDGNGLVSNEELVEWIKHVASRYVYDDVDRHWGYHDSNDDKFITWEEYKNTAYGMVEDPNEIHDHHRNLTYTQAIARELKRFKLADGNSDDKLTRDEFANFLHPQEAPHMREIVIEETMMDMDKNFDGFVELEEYISDLWPTFERKENSDEPDWVSSERDQFNTHRDKDKDGKLNKKELGDWIIPEDFNHAEAEAKHLIYEADANKDQMLSKDEILNQQDLFVGSQATDFGDYLVRHDEF